MLEMLAFFCFFHFYRDFSTHATIATLLLDSLSISFFFPVAASANRSHSREQLLCRLYIPILDKRSCLSTKRNTCTKHTHFPDLKNDVSSLTVPLDSRRKKRCASDRILPVARYLRNQTVLARA